MHRPTRANVRSTAMRSLPAFLLLAVSAASPRPAGEAPLLEPGAAEIVTQHLRASMDSVRYLTPRPGDTARIEFARGWRELHLVNNARGPAILLVSASTFNGRTFRDSALVLRAGLVPIWEVMYNNARRTRIDYDGAHVRLTSSIPDSSREHTYDVRVFHFNELDVLLRSIPLRDGYEAILPLYSEGSDQLEMDTVRVLGRDAGVWQLRFADPAIIATIGIDDRTRRQVSYRNVARSDSTRGVTQVLVPQHGVR